ncbi:MAG: hypothetical protein RR640_05805, partial [Oscillospiraceae bacterium]
MLLNSAMFLMAFLPIVLFFYFICFRKVGIKTKNFILVIASIVFLVISDSFFSLIVLLLSVVNYIFGRRLYINKSKKLLFGLVFTNVILISAYYGVSYIFVETLNTKLFYTPIPLIGLIFLINSVSFILNCYKKNSPFEIGLFRNLLFLLFFPTITAGPVINYESFILQANEREYSFNAISRGIKKFCIGLAKVIILGQTLSFVAKTGFASAPNITIIFSYFAIGCFILQVYYELSGFADMGIGIAMMFGFKIPENFSHPLVCNSFSSFVSKFNSSVLDFTTNTLLINNKKAVPFLTIAFESLIFSLFFGLNQNTLITFSLFFICLLFEQYVLRYFIFKNKIINLIIQAIFFYPVLIIIFTFIASKDFNSAIGYLSVLINPFAGVYNVTSGNMFISEYTVILIISILGILPLANIIKKRLIKYKISIFLYTGLYLLI